MNGSHGRCRAPVLVAVALIEDGMSPEDAVVYIRKHRRGAINSKQIKFLQKYKPQAGKGPGAACCVVM
jgi:protein tyrosine phosphatase type 4A